MGMSGSYAQLGFEDQAKALESLVQRLSKKQINAKALQEVLSYAREIPEQFYPPTLLPLVSAVFGIDEKTIRDGLMGPHALPVEPFENLLPQSGWLHDYIEYTKNTEPPTAFHFFAGAVIIGSTIARRVYFPKGSGDVFPNLSCVLVAPSGRCKKTTACNLAVNLFRRIGGNVLANKITPEAIVETLSQSSTATGLIYAPEWSVFLGKQQYLEGLVPMLTDLFDCPATWSSGTLMRGTAQLSNVAISHLAATTIDWMQTSISEDTFAGGFMSRLLFIVQDDTPRSFPLPPPLDTTLGKRLVDGLLGLQHITGSASFSPEAEEWYKNWYTNRHNLLTDRHFAGYFERKPDRMIQLSLILNASQNPKNLVIDLATLRKSESLLNWIERFLPAAFEELSQSNIGADQIRLLKQLRKSKGQLQYSDWLRLNTRRMDTGTFKRYLETLKAAKMITMDPVKHTYYLLPAGKAVQ